MYKLMKIKNGRPTGRLRHRYLNSLGGSWILYLLKTLDTCHGDAKVLRLESVRSWILNKACPPHPLPIPASVFCLQTKIGKDLQDLINPLEPESLKLLSLSLVLFAQEFSLSSGFRARSSKINRERVIFFKMIKSHLILCLFTSCRVIKLPSRCLGSKTSGSIKPLPSVSTKCLLNFPAQQYLQSLPAETQLWGLP